MSVNKSYYFCNPAGCSSIQNYLILCLSYVATTISSPLPNILTAWLIVICSAVEQIQTLYKHPVFYNSKSLSVSVINYLGSECAIFEQLIVYM